MAFNLGNTTTKTRPNDNLENKMKRSIWTEIVEMSPGKAVLLNVGADFHLQLIFCEMAYRQDLLQLFII